MLENDPIKKIKDKWSHLLDESPDNTLDKDYQKKVMDLLLEQQSKYFQAIADGDDEAPAWIKKGLRLIRTPYAYYDNHWISVQPMNSTPSLIFYLDMMRDKKKQSTKSLLAPDCIPCGGEGGRHKLGCPINKE